MRTVGIIGGGIGGMAAAAALHKLGIHATVYERAPRLEEVGAGMMLWPNATRVLKTLGLLDDVAARSGPNTHFLVRASGGKVLVNLALGSFDVPALCTRPSDLLASLFPRFLASTSAWSVNGCVSRRPNSAFRYISPTARSKSMMP
jgi:salicylate hydroxylase